VYVITIMDLLPFARDWSRTPGADSRICAIRGWREIEEFRRYVPGTPGVQQGIIPAEDPDIRAQLMAEIDT
jgi:hypothetical protein